MKQSSRIITLIKKDPVLVAAWILAVISAFFVRPDREYAGYIDLRTLGILWALMLIIQGWSREGVFTAIGRGMLRNIRREGLLTFALVFICFISSMFITNDVALITFVPFAIMILTDLHREDLLIPVVVLQTVAANLGSMLTPIGNPQNLYLYGISGMSTGELVKLMLPYCLVSAGMLAAVVPLILRYYDRKRGTAPDDIQEVRETPGSHTGEQKDEMPGKRQSAHGTPVMRICIYLGLFVFMLLGVLRLVPWALPVIVTVAVVFAADRSLLPKADYALLATFTGFFIFTGNMGRMPVIRDFLQSLISGHEVAVAVLLSQVISNVPAALLLSGFTTDYAALMVGVDLGGLGTLIASMASLISWKACSGTGTVNPGRYLGFFTAVNLLFLAVLVAVHFVL